MTTFAALLAGLATSLHCAGMCGPIACGLGTLAKSEGERLTAATLYHGTRLVSYGLIGAVCGALGRQPLKWFFDSPAVLLPWVLVAVLLAMALGLDKRVPRPAVFNRLTARVRAALSGFWRGPACGIRREGRGVHPRVRPWHRAVALACPTSVPPHPRQADSTRHEPSAARAGACDRADVGMASSRHHPGVFARCPAGCTTTPGRTSILLPLIQKSRRTGSDGLID